MDISVNFSLNHEDFYEFQMAWLKHRKHLAGPTARAQRSMFLLLWAVIAALFVLLVLLINLDVPTPPPPLPPIPLRLRLLGTLAALVPISLLIGLACALILWLRRARFIYRKLAPQVARLDEPSSARFTDTHVTIEAPGCTTTMQWTYFLRFIETDSTFLFFIRPRMAHINPKRAFSPEQLNQLRTFAQAHIANPTKAFPVEPTPTSHTNANLPPASAHSK